MSKKVISFRLSDDDLAALDQAAKRFKMNRSEVLSAAIRAFQQDYVNQGRSFVERTPWWLEDLEGHRR